MMKFVPVLLVIFISSVISSKEYDYYWREYTGAIPTDAVVGGQDINGDDIYIGQAYIKNHGLMVVQIYPGNREVKAPIWGVQTVNKYTKILCGPMENFAWLAVSSSNLHLSLLNKHAVIGGHEDGRGQINIGRINYEGETRIGKVNSFFAGSSDFRFVDNKNKEPIITTYEVLVYYKSEVNSN